MGLIVKLLSRPVLSFQTSIPKMEQFAENPEDPYILWNDPFCNVQLMNYLVNGKVDGQINKNDIEKTALPFILEKGIVKYRKDNETLENNWVVPSIEKREELIATTHLLGHFGRTTVFNQLKTKYYWKSMKNEIAMFIDNCLTCLRHQKQPEMQHSALV